MCFLHTPDPKKYLPTTVEKYFGKSLTLSRALESEVAAADPSRVLGYATPIARTFMIEQGLTSLKQFAVRRFEWSTFELRIA